MSDRLRILVAAYACSPVQGSEAGVGWGWVRALSRHHDLWVLTGAHFRDDIESELERVPELRRHITFKYIPRYRAMLLERVWEPAYLWTYKHQWQREAYHLAYRMHREIRFDLVHQLTYVGFRVPGYLWKLDAPFIWGPLGGLEQIPWRLIGSMPWRGRTYCVCHNFWNEFDRRFAPSPRRVFKRASALIAATTGTRDEIRRLYQRDSSVICEIGVPPSVAFEPCVRYTGEPLRLVWSGLHEHRKALPILFRALAKLPQYVNWRLTILGSGPCSDGWKRTARDLGIGYRCEWLGQLPRTQALKEMRAAHALVITSLYDLTSTVLIEGLASGLPVICPDLYGFRDAVTEECGYRLNAANPATLIESMVRAILDLHDCEPQRFRMALAAIKRSLLYDWERKADAVNRIYRLVTRNLPVPVQI